MPPGIGKSIAKKLAGQGLNVVLVALGDAVLDAAHKELTEQYPRVSFRKVGYCVNSCWPLSALNTVLRRPLLVQMFPLQGFSAAGIVLMFGQSHCSQHAGDLAPQPFPSFSPSPSLPACLPACLPLPAPGAQVGVNLGQPGYMDTIAKQTADIDIQVVFCNAGYVLTGFFADV